MGADHKLRVNNRTHTLHFSGRAFPCDRDIETALQWNNHALLLSSDTDCLSLWDREGLVRLTRVGVYPQDMAIHGDTAVVCGGANGRIHLLTLPNLHATAEYDVPGLPERVALHGNTACLLSLMADDDIQTMLLMLDLHRGTYQELARFSGLPGAITASNTGLWIGIGEMLLHIPHGRTEADLLIEGFGLVHRIEVQEDGVLITDPLEGMIAHVTQTPRPAIEVLYRGDVGQYAFS